MEVIVLHHCLIASFLSFSSMTSIPWNTVLQEVLQYESFPQAAILSKLFQCGSIPLNTVPQEQPVAMWVPHRVTLFTGKSLLQHGFLQGVTAPSSHICLLSVDSVDRLQGDSLPPMVFTTSFRENSVWAPRTLLPSSSQIWHLQSCLTHSHSSLLWPQLFLYKHFFLLLKYIIKMTDIEYGLSHQRDCLGFVWHWLYQKYEKLLSASCRSHPCSPCTNSQITVQI